MWGRRSWEKRGKKELKEKRKKKERIKKQERRENYKLIHTDKQTDRQTDRQTGRRMDGRTDRHKSFIDVRYYTEQYSKSNSIELNRMEIKSAEEIK